MIKSFKLYNESLLDKISGPSEDEIIKNLEDKPDRLLKVSLRNNSKKGVDYALKNNANVGLLTEQELDVLINTYNYDINIIMDKLSFSSLYSYGVYKNNVNLIKRSIEMGKIISDYDLVDLYEENNKLFNKIIKELNFEIPNNIANTLIYKDDVDTLKLLIKNGFNIKEEAEKIMFGAAMIRKLNILNYLIHLGFKTPKDFNFDEIMYDDVVEILKNNMEK